MCAVLCFDPQTLIFALLVPATGRPGNGQRTQRPETGDGIAASIVTLMASQSLRTMRYTGKSYVYRGMWAV